MMSICSIVLNVVEGREVLEPIPVPAIFIHIQRRSMVHIPLPAMMYICNAPAVLKSIKDTRKLVLAAFHVQQLPVLQSRVRQLALSSAR